MLRPKTAEVADSRLYPQHACSRGSTDSTSESPTDGACVDRLLHPCDSSGCPIPPDCSCWTQQMAPERVYQDQSAVTVSCCCRCLLLVSRSVSRIQAACSTPSIRRFHGPRVRHLGCCVYFQTAHLPRTTTRRLLPPEGVLLPLAGHSLQISTEVTLLHPHPDPFPRLIFLLRQRTECVT